MKTDLKELALDVNDLLSRYIVVHDTLIKKSGLFSIFTTINFADLAETTKNTLGSLKMKREEVEQLGVSLKDDKEKRFAGHLLTYTDALITTVDLLHKMLEALAEKSKGGKLSLKEYLDKNKQYKDSIEDYTRYGEQLNELFRTV